MYSIALIPSETFRKPAITEMAAEVEKKARTISKRRFTRAYNRLNEVLLNKEEADVIDSQFKELKILWENVQAKHDEYVLAIHPDAEDPHLEEEEEWLNIVQERFAIIQRERYRYERSMKEEKDAADWSLTEEKLLSESAESVNISKQKRELQKMMFIEEVITIEKSANDDVNGYLQSYIVQVQEMSNINLTNVRRHTVVILIY